MPSINVDLNYFEHFKTKRLIYKLGRGAEIIPIRLWIYAAKFSQKNGVFFMKSEELFNLAGIDHQKDVEKVMAALIETGFIEKLKNGYKIHEWHEYQGHIVAYKERAKHAAKERWDRLKGNKKKRKPMTDKEIEKNWEK